ncbi:zinc finger MYND domain-containing protein [Phanerochaete sordida]|uniref:Zinc finger MYND domain-containing protein n=1 Tax=Phanerochaete sordida TaxID=48140 RepID=A0A9P3GRG1_9APHY|nr:zinc finger MYND domain-containing protein [Phanerochaete sordida]
MPGVTLDDLKRYYDVLTLTAEFLPLDYTMAPRANPLTAGGLEEFNSRLDPSELLMRGMDPRTGKVANPKYILELTTRMVCGCGFDDLDMDAFRTMLHDIAENTQFNAPTRARAFSLLAYFYRLMGASCEQDLTRFPALGLLSGAVEAANGAAELGLFSRATLGAGTTFEEAGLRHGGSGARASDPDESRRMRAAGCDAFWRGYDRRTKVYSRKAAPKLEEERFACDAGCGIVASKSSAVKRCAGKCPTMFKPVYCSKSCQKLDWERHRKICRSNASEADFHALPAASYSDDQVLASLPPEPASTNTWHRDDCHRLLDMRNMSCGHNFANEYSIDVFTEDGKTLRMYSPSLSADEMKRMKILVRHSSKTNVCLIECIENPGERMSCQPPGSERLAVVRVRPGFWMRNGFLSQIWPSTKFNMDTMDMIRDDSV